MTTKTKTGSVDLFAVYDRAFAAYGPRGWWPLVPPGGGAPLYLAGRWRSERTAAEIFEIGAGAILTQRLAWRSAAVTIAELARLDALTPHGLLGLGIARLEAAVRPAGTWRRKAATLRHWAEWCRASHGARREAATVPPEDSLAEIPGFGPETTDSVLLYGYGAPRFIADAYARRILVRVGIVREAATYAGSRSEIESRFPMSREQCDEIHALLVEVGKRHCRTRPLCAGCPLETCCVHARAASGTSTTSSRRAPSRPSRGSPRAPSGAPGRRTDTRARGRGTARVRRCSPPR